MLGNSSDIVLTTSNRSCTSSPVSTSSYEDCTDQKFTSERRPPSFVVSRPAASLSDEEVYDSANMQHASPAPRPPFLTSALRSFSQTSFGEEGIVARALFIPPTAAPNGVETIADLIAEGERCRKRQLASLERRKLDTRSLEGPAIEGRAQQASMYNRMSKHYGDHTLIKNK
ncbi:hypothetical protein PYCC9005_001877 [Savitreella phatthalungensis]